MTEVGPHTVMTNEQLQELLYSLLREAEIRFAEHISRIPEWGDGNGED